MKALLTGATGFLGTHLAMALQARGHTVVALARSTGGDVLDPVGLRSRVAGCDVAFHCAGRVSRRPQDAEALYQLHVQGTKNVLGACEAAGVRRVVLASTSGTVAVGDSPGHVATEESPTPLGLVSRWPYYRSKLFAERAALASSRDGFEVVSVNPSLLLGPGDVNRSSTEDVRLFLEGALPAVPAGGLSFVDVRDAAEAMCLAMERGRAGERYLVGACNLTVRDFFARLERVSGVRGPWVGLPRSREVARLGARLVEQLAARVGLPVPPVDSVSVEMAQCFWYLDASKARRDLGWTARDAGVTLHDTVEDLRLRGVVWPRPGRNDGDGLVGRGGVDAR